MTEQTCVRTHQQMAWRLRKAAITLAVIVAAQIAALEVVLRGWQGEDAVSVFAGIGTSALLYVLAVIIFLRTRQKKPQ